MARAIDIWELLAISIMVHRHGPRNIVLRGGRPNVRRKCLAHLNCDALVLDQLLVASSLQILVKLDHRAAMLERATMVKWVLSLERVLAHLLTNAIAALLGLSEPLAMACDRVALTALGNARQTAFSRQLRALLLVHAVSLTVSLLLFIILQLPGAKI